MAGLKTAGFTSQPCSSFLGNVTFNPACSNVNISSSQNVLPPDALRVAQIVVAVIIFAIGLPFNGLVIWVLGFRRSGRNSFAAYVLNLAIADLVLVMRIPLAIGYLVAYYQWSFGELTCKLIMFLRVLGLFAGAFLLSAISLERCLCLLHPMWYRLKRPPWVVPVTCVLLWSLALGLSIPYLQSSQVCSLRNRSQCFESLLPQPGLYITETVLGFLLPLLLFISCNLVILLKAKRDTSPKYAKLFKVLTLTIVVFLICWVPYHICRFLKSLYSSCPNSKIYAEATKGVYYSLYLVFVKSSLNPALYVFAGKDLRKSVKASLMSVIEGIFSDEPSDSRLRRSLRGQESLV
ncbi:C3a anaphylatoxin chemotactic receptor [Erpetoichthys calabaricus]|uniref:C3a anaphylatoxin chemotactic receptor-like n=1 Tax=Erpetoichthys calabaricus TaxID=27687 RepID=A0A8C4TFK0_ERPCA|nr:C3a anaphylatoxin chemotactic receptor [Erpetoichthys calabaricus]